MPEQKFLTFDIGSAWTKAFLVSMDSQNIVHIEQSFRLPSSWGDFSVSVKLLQSREYAYRLRLYTCGLDTRKTNPACE